MVVDFGPSTALDNCRAIISDKAYFHARVASMRELDLLVAVLLPRAGSGEFRLVLVSLSPPLKQSWAELTPIVVYPRAHSGAGLLTSPTTRTDGLIAASDLCSHDDRHGRGQTRHRDGGPAGEVYAPDNVRALQDIRARVSANHELIWPMLWAFALVGTISFALIGVLVAMPVSPKRRAYQALKLGLLVSACAPVSMLLASAAPAGVAGYAAGTAVSLAALVAAGFGGERLLRKSRLRALPVLICFSITVAVVIIDSLTGGALCKFALPSSYQLTALRFYGIGNEYTGALIAMAAVVCLFIEGRGGARLSGALTLSVGVLTVLVLGIGSFGANYGGVVAAVIIFGLAWWAIRHARFGAIHVAAVFAFSAVIVFAMAVIEWRLEQSAASHAGRAIGLLEQSGVGFAVAIAARKAAVAINLMGTKQAQWGIAAFVPFLVMWFYRVRDKVASMFKSDERLIWGLRGVIIGCVVAFLMNDSGLVFAAIMASMTMLILLYSLLEEKERREGI